MAITSAFQADDEGSIPSTCSNNRHHIEVILQCGALFYILGKYSILSYRVAPKEVIYFIFVMQSGQPADRKGIPVSMGAKWKK